MENTYTSRQITVSAICVNGQTLTTTYHSSETPLAAGARATELLGSWVRRSEGDPVHNSPILVGVVHDPVAHPTYRTVMVTYDRSGVVKY